MESESPLRFLDFDCSRYLYETYFPSADQRRRYDHVMRELNMFVNRHITNRFVRQFRGAHVHAPSIQSGIRQAERLSRRQRGQGTGVKTWFWIGISAEGQRVSASFIIDDIGHGEGVSQFGGWRAKSYPPHIDDYYDSRRFLRSITHPEI
jgi:hypothetical protein